MDIRIDGDPTSWTLTRPVDASEVAASGEPVVLAVAEPLAGRLLLSPRSVGSVVFFQPAMDPHHGVVPNGVRLPEQCLYVPSTTGPDPHSNPARYYLLPTGTDLAALETEIKAAMSGAPRSASTSPGRTSPASSCSTGRHCRSLCSAQPPPAAEIPQTRQEWTGGAS